MPEYVRVKHKVNGSESSIFRNQYDFAPDEFDLLDKPAVNSGGQPLPAKHKTTAKKAAAKKTAATRSTNSASKESANSADEAGQSAETKKES